MPTPSLYAHAADLARAHAQRLMTLMDEIDDRRGLRPAGTRTVLVGDKRLAELKENAQSRRCTLPYREADRDELDAIVRELVLRRSGRMGDVVRLKGDPVLYQVNDTLPVTKRRRRKKARP